MVNERFVRKCAVKLTGHVEIMYNMSQIVNTLLLDRTLFKDSYLSTMITLQKVSELSLPNVFTFTTLTV